MMRKIFCIQGSVLVLAALFADCYAQSTSSTSGQKKKEDYYLLGLLGYNYTDRHISDYSVNGGSGGHIFLSSRTGGGSGVGCCVRLSKKNPKISHVRIRWQFDGCIYLIKDPASGKEDKVRHYYYKEKDVEVLNVAREEPHYLETHFFPDGTVKAMITSEISSASLQLEEGRPDKSRFGACKNDEKPAGE